MPTGPFAAGAQRGSIGRLAGDRSTAVVAWASSRRPDGPLPGTPVEFRSFARKGGGEGAKPLLAKGLRGMAICARDYVRLMPEWRFLCGI
jgi:hypothetical protein